MPTVAQDARVTVLIADTIAADLSGKANALGLGFTYTALLPQGTTPAQSVLVWVDLPARHDGAQFALSVELRNLDTDTAVLAPGPSGRPEALRIQQMVTAQRGAALPGFALPPDFPIRVQVLLGFPTGLPISAPGRYAWVADIDTQHRPTWEAVFHVLGPPPGPVIGGPAQPTDLPNIGLMEQEDFVRRDDASPKDPPVSS